MGRLTEAADLLPGDLGGHAVRIHSEPGGREADVAFGLILEAGAEVLEADEKWQGEQYRAADGGEGG